MSLSQAQNVFMPGNINSIVSLYMKYLGGISSSAWKESWEGLLEVTDVSTSWAEGCKLRENKCALNVFCQVIICKMQVEISNGLL